MTLPPCLDRAGGSPAPIAAGRPPARTAAGRAAVLLFSLLSLAVAGCAPGPDEEAEPVDVVVPEGAGALGVGRELERAGLVRFPRAFALYAALRGAADELQAGRYRFAADAGWNELLTALREGRVVTRAVTVPPGFELRRIAPRVAEVAGVPPDSVLRLARDPTLARALGIPGPTLEGYVFPETYRFADGVNPRRALAEMVSRYRRFWRKELQERADSLGLSERAVVTLASIVEKEARVPGERPLIAAVYLNRLEEGMPLQADPTVRYALDLPRGPLLYSHLRAAADSPYSTYARPGLPPGPIASPGAASLRSVVRAPDVPFLYFVARADGSHAFSVTHREHVNAKNRIREGR